MISVKFTRQKTDIQIAAVDVDGERLKFNKEVAFKDLEQGKRYPIRWHITGAGGGELVVTKTVAGLDEEIVKSAIKPGMDRWADITDFVA